MSNSKRAKEKRKRRSHLNKHQRDILTRQHTGDYQGMIEVKRKKDKDWIIRLMNKKENLIMDPY